MQAPLVLVYSSVRIPSSPPVLNMKQPAERSAVFCSGRGFRATGARRWGGPTAGSGVTPDATYQPTMTRADDQTARALHRAQIYRCAPYATLGVGASAIGIALLMLG